MLRSAQNSACISINSQGKSNKFRFTSICNLTPFIGWMRCMMQLRSTIWTWYPNASIYQPSYFQKQETSHETHLIRCSSFNYCYRCLFTAGSHPSLPHQYFSVMEGSIPPVPTVALPRFCRMPVGQRIAVPATYLFKIRPQLITLIKSAGICLHHSWRTGFRPIFKSLCIIPCSLHGSAAFLLFFFTTGPGTIKP